MTVYELVTEKIIEQLEKGDVPWRRPWGSIGKPQNYVTQKEYRGINTILLSCARVSSPYWLTFRQAKELGGSIKKGAKAFPVVFFNWKEKELDNGDKSHYPFLRYYQVFNADHTEGIAYPEPERRDILPIPECERILVGMPNRPILEHCEPRAYYSPSRDFVNMPKKNLFHHDQGYYATLFHELAHSTGHATRLKRHKEGEMECIFGSENYAREELVAEMGSAFLCAEAGLDNLTIENQAAYVSSWLKALRNDKRLVVLAAAQGQKAADYILNKTHREEAVTAEAKECV